jgi:hypothetical protein
VVLLVTGCIMAILTAIFMIRRTVPNRRALRGTPGYIVGKVKRFDERMQVFARNRALPPGSEQYTQFYVDYPELEQSDAERREKGGPLGTIGLIDRPHEGPNVAATLASLSIPFNLSLLGQSRDRLLHMHEGLSLEPCKDVSSPIDRLAHRQK